MLLRSFGVARVLRFWKSIGSNEIVINIELFRNAGRPELWCMRDPTNVFVDLAEVCDTRFLGIPQ